MNSESDHHDNAKANDEDDEFEDGVETRCLPSSHERAVVGSHDVDLNFGVPAQSQQAQTGRKTQRLAMTKSKGLDIFISLILSGQLRQ